MAGHKSDSEFIRDIHTIQRASSLRRGTSLGFCCLVTIAWGTYGYFHMPQRKDPEYSGAICGGLTPMARSSRGTR